jgi:hypothetical protein
MNLRIISGITGLIFLSGTGVLVLNLLRMEPDAGVLLAAYMGIGGILLGAYLMFYALAGEWRPNLLSRKRTGGGSAGR